MGDRGDYQRGTRVYVGGLSHETKKEDLETEFEKFGKLNNVWVAFNPPGFAFIEFSNKTDAENACDYMNGIELMGGKLRVELSRSRRMGGFRGSGGRGRGGSRGIGGGPGGGGRFPVRGRGNLHFGGSSGGRGGSGGGSRGGFPRMSREFTRGGRSRESFGGNGVSYGSHSYSGVSHGYSGGRNGYSGGSGGSSRYRSRSPAGMGHRGRRY